MDGILPLWKTKGMTSHDCVFHLRKILGTKKVGHTGTLDPEVEGVLPICIGKATRIAEYVTDAGKTYIGEVTFGFTTTTEDQTGEVVEQTDIERTSISMQSIEQAVKELTGVIQQTPPMFSAVKVNGRRLYEYARKGEAVERPTRTVTIYSFSLLTPLTFNEETKTASLSFEVSCSKGTYIRTLAVMLGEKLGLPSHMSKLVRTKSATFTSEDCVTLEQLKFEKENNQDLTRYLLPLERGISHLPKWEISDTVAEKVRNGAVLEAFKEWPEGEDLVRFEYEGKTLALYEQHTSKEGMWKPRKVIPSF